MALRVTAVITAHNRRAFLPQAVASARAAGADEIVVVRNFDDPIPDAPSGLQLVRYDGAPTGEKEAIGTERATGDVVAFLDDDDLWEPAKVARIRDRFERQPDLTYVCNNQHPVGADGRAVEARHPELVGKAPARFAQWDKRDFRRLLEQIWPGNNSSTCVRRSWALDQLAALRRVGWGCDTFWLVMAWLDGRPFDILAEPLTALRLHVENMSQTRGSGPDEFRRRHEEMCRRFAGSNAALAAVVRERKGPQEAMGSYFAQSAVGFEFLAELEADHRARAAAWRALGHGPSGRDGSVRRAALATLVSPAWARRLLYRSNLRRWQLSSTPAASPQD
jgi:hypothetical protein